MLSDFTLLGAFRPPDPTGDLVDFGSGLALRRVAGTPYLYMMGYYGNTVEFTIPADGSLADGGGYTTATVTGQYGDIFQNAAYQACVDDGTGVNGPKTGLAGGVRFNNLYWDESDSYLYATRFANYDNDVGISDTCLCRCTLNFGAKTGTGIAIWKLSAPGSPSTDAMTDVGVRWVNGVTRIPSGFATTYLGGRTLGVGFGNPATSIAINGPISMGPAFFALNPSDLNVAQDRDYYSGSSLIKMLFHPFKETLSAPFRKTRPSSYQSNYRQSGTDYNASHAYVTDFDWMNGGVWIRGTTKEGLLIPSIGSLGTANTSIVSSASNTALVVSSAAGMEIGDLLFGQTVNSHSNGTYPFSHGIISNIVGTAVTIQAGTVVDSETGAADSSNWYAGGWAYTGSIYIGGGPKASRVSSLWYLYGSDHLADAATGGTAASAVTPADEGFMDYAGITFPAYNVQDLRIIGVAFDEVTKRLYVAVQNVPSVSGVLINVFDVNC